MGIFPFPICFTIFAICLRAFSSWFTCCTVVPLPRAIRARREPLMSSGAGAPHGHGEDDRLDLAQLAVVDVGALELLAEAGDKPTIDLSGPIRRIMR